MSPKEQYRSSRSAWRPSIQPTCHDQGSPARLASADSRLCMYVVPRRAVSCCDVMSRDAGHRHRARPVAIVLCTRAAAGWLAVLSGRLERRAGPGGGVGQCSQAVGGGGTRAVTVRGRGPGPGGGQWLSRAGTVRGGCLWRQGRWPAVVRVYEDGPMTGCDVGMGVLIMGGYIT